MLSVYDLTQLGPKVVSGDYTKALELGFDSVLVFPFDMPPGHPHRLGHEYERSPEPAVLEPAVLEATAAELRFIARLPPHFLGRYSTKTSSHTRDGPIDPRCVDGNVTERLTLSEIEDAIELCQRALSQLVFAGYHGIFAEAAIVPFVEAALTRLAAAGEVASFLLIVCRPKNTIIHDKLIFPYTALPTSLENAAGKRSITLYRENTATSPRREIHDSDQLSRYLAQAVWRAATDGPAWRCPSALVIDDDVRRAIAEANGYRRSHPTLIGRSDAMPLNAPDTSLLAEILGRHTQTPILRLTNTDLNRRLAIKPMPLLARSDGLALKEPDRSDTGEDNPLILEPGETQWKTLRRSPEIRAPGSLGGIDLEQALRVPRIRIANLQPRAPETDGMVKRVVGDEVVVECDLLCDGHDVLGGHVLWRPADAAHWQTAPLLFKENDRWNAPFTVSRVGLHLYSLEVWRDDLATYQRELAKKAAAGQDISLVIREGVELLRRAERVAKAEPALWALLRDWHERLSRLDGEQLVSHIDSLPAIGRALDLRSFMTHHDTDTAFWVDRYSAAFSAWYEIFPRSQSKVPGQHGSFIDVIDQLPAIREMGFDTLYFPPIHPIGRINRKGRNNSLEAAEGDPGSPYAIGAVEGGHDALHPALGSMADFHRLRDAAASRGIELAMDFAIQCAPDHPWLTQHPEWFRWRPDGSIHYAENPPKKYEDIVNVDFYAPGAMPSLWLALRDIVLFWRKQGIRTFRVDNPHTKPLPFWRWLIKAIQAAYPDTIFLSEAFTRPKIMYRLAEIGFTQSYTYFTWRNTKPELEDYLTEITQGAYREVFRPHFFVNTPDINPRFLQQSGRPGFLIRAALAATLSGLWGVYNGFEICEARALPGKEEYLDSEKYQLRHWDRHAPGNIVREITQLNRIRRENPAFHSHLGLTFLKADNDQIIYFCKRSPGNDNTVLVAINLDPRQAQSAIVEIPLWFWNLPDDGALKATDLLTGRSFVWHGKLQRISLDPFQNPYAIWRITEEM
ncbi:MAG TPA: alpha-1,4-glucan--maltose-1-phosphate maltosyltransferase [Terriglobia bacterium]|nr:alpha-1,4-glucan--maltose-1-phosphate maltosyltransferase [Terriglobia bacterium]